MNIGAMTMGLPHNAGAPLSSLESTILPQGLVHHPGGAGIHPANSCQKGNRAMINNELMKIYRNYPEP